jgi:hypothetical protein
MSFYVLCAASLPGKSALAHEATAAALAVAAAAGDIVTGPYLEWSDPDANNGMGAERWTDDIEKAKRFASFSEAMNCWKAQSSVRPFRSDGRPNRPLTAFSVSPQLIEDV